MTMQSTPEPERATQDQGTQIPIQDEASDAKQESAAQQGGAAPEAADAASDAVKEAEEVLEAQAEEAPTNDELVEKAQAEAKDWQDKYLRLHAEWDTYRRRTAEQREQERLRAGEKLVEKLQQAGYKLAEVAYSQQGADPAAGAAAGAQSDDGPIEADYEVVDDKEGK